MVTQTGRGEGYDIVVKKVILHVDRGAFRGVLRVLEHPLPARVVFTNTVLQAQERGTITNIKNINLQKSTLDVYLEVLPLLDVVYANRSAWLH